MKIRIDHKVFSAVLILTVLASCDALGQDSQQYEDPYLLRLADQVNSDIEDLCGIYNIVTGTNSASVRNGKEIKELNIWEHLYTDDEFPLFMVDYISGEFYWTLNGDKLSPVGDGTVVPSVKISGGEWYYSYGDDSVWKKVKTGEKSDPGLMKIKDETDLFYSLVFPSGYSVVLLTKKGVQATKKDVPLKSFYNDVFLDAGIGLISRNFLYAARYLGLGLECVSYSSVADTVVQNPILGGSEIDLNGRLLYPDGQPRYRMLFVDGGNSREHGEYLGTRSREMMRTFIKNGGVYVGTCAGAFFVSNGYDDHEDYKYYLNMFPGIIKHSKLVSIYTGVTIPEDSPLLRYYDFGGDGYVNKVHHNKGGYLVNPPTGAEILGFFDYPSKTNLHGQPCVWAYKYDDYTGRIVATGSHPEENNSGEVRDLAAAMMQYALDGQGYTEVKGLLQKGVARVMDKSTSDNYPAFARIGDKQTHHFAFIIPEGNSNVTISLKSDVDCDMALMIDKDTYAYEEDAHYVQDSEGSVKTMSFEKLEPGLWFLGVKCNTTVDSVDLKYGQAYSGRTDVLNGVPYSVVVDWETE